MSPSSVATHPNAGACRRQSPALAYACAHAYPNSTGLVVSLIDEIACLEGAGVELVAVRLYRLLAAADDPALEVGLALYLHLKPTIPGPDARGFGHAQVGALDVLFGQVQVGRWGWAYGEAATDAALLACVVAAVLPTFDTQVAADCGIDLPGTYYRTA